jgi:transcriptional regulator with XRE-family HTH domain
MDIQNERERLKAVMDSEGMNAKQFAMEVGISAGTLSNILSGRNRPSLDVMQAVLYRFRQVRSDWLILGSGSMHYGQADRPQQAQDEALAQEESVAESVAQPLQQQAAQPLQSAPRPMFREPSLFGDDDVVPVVPARADTQESAGPGTGGCTASVPVQRVRRQPRQPSAAVQQPQACRRLVRIVLMYDDGTFEER